MEHAKTHSHDRDAITFDNIIIKLSELVLKLNRIQDMEQVAELGFFIIKYIERFNLNLTVGIDNKGPCVFYMPEPEFKIRQNGKTIDFRPNPDQLRILEGKANKRIRKHERQLASLFKEITYPSTSTTNF